LTPGVVPDIEKWPWQDLNLRATGYEPAALTTELQGRGRRDASTRGGSHGTAASDTLPCMVALASAASGQTIDLLITFIGIGILVNVLIVYVIAQVLGERKQNQERQRQHG
jgi:hypothetical protein